MICALVAQGKKVGVMANSHTVIGNLLGQVTRAAEQANVGMAGRKRMKPPSPATGRRGRIESRPDRTEYQTAGAADARRPWPRGWTANAIATDWSNDRVIRYKRLLVN